MRPAAARVIGPQPVDYVAPTLAPPYRVLVLLAATDGWYRADATERAGVLEELDELLRGAESSGARLLASFDDDLFVTGQPMSLPYSISIVYEVDELDAIVGMVNGLRTSSLGRYLRAEARIGRPLFLLAR